MRRSRWSLPSIRAPSLAALVVLVLLASASLPVMSPLPRAPGEARTVPAPADARVPPSVPTSQPLPAWRSAGTASTVPIAPAYAGPSTETGLPGGTERSINQTGGATWSGTGTSVSWTETNGSNAYPAATFDEGNAAPGGRHSLDGGSVSVPVMFQAVVFPIDFVETGLPSSTNWSVTIDGEIPTSTGPTLEVGVANGTYPYTVAVASAAWQVIEQSGNATVNGRPVEINESFEPAYPITVTESGLPIGAFWNVSAQGLLAAGPLEGSAIPSQPARYVFSTSAHSLTFSLPNGTFSLTISSDFAGWAPSAPTAFEQVNGAASAPTVSETFTSTSGSPALIPGLGSVSFYLLVAAVVAIAVGAMVALRLKRSPAGGPPQAVGDGPDAQAPPAGAPSSAGPAPPDGPTERPPPPPG